MPAAELFGMWAVAEAARAASGRPCTSVTAVGDCDPAAGALNSVASRNPQMRGLLAGARQLTRQWLAVSIPREYNLDADRLSHPRMLGDVRADALAAGLVVHDAPIPTACWEVLQSVSHDTIWELRDGIGKGGGSGEGRGGRRRRTRRRGWGDMTALGGRDSPKA
jgi:hypothetical protein